MKLRKNMYFVSITLAVGLPPLAHMAKSMAWCTASNPSALAIGLLQSCTKSAKYCVKKVRMNVSQSRLISRFESKTGYALTGFAGTGLQDLRACIAIWSEVTVQYDIECVIRTEQVFRDW